ncbi:response regulator [Salininema proteolyticum]|uniref:Response regulator n=1 Tax=Salininema proteolyticum TaxID=1607685 RepID=A0ABV8U465_9ACTN
MATRILIADDQVMVRAGFSALLDAQEDLTVVGGASDGREAVSQAREFKPDVILMDVRMPGMDGLQAARAVLEEGSSPHVLMLTTFDIDDYVYEALRIGASGFLLKDAPPEDLISAVRVVASGEALLAPAITKRLIEEFFRDRPVLSASSRLDRLTPREIDVLRLVARGQANGEIAATLYVSEQTVKSHVSSIFSKLSLRDRAQAVIVAYESGLVTAGDPKG